MKNYLWKLDKRNTQADTLMHTNTHERIQTYAHSLAHSQKIFTLYDKINVNQN